MGQGISRNLAARLSQATQRQENKMMRELLDETLQKKHRGDKYTDPNAIVWGFKRGDSGALPKEYEQENFLKKTNQGGGGNNANLTSTEMPPDLVDFLKAVGPISRKVDKDMTSSKVYDSLVTTGDMPREIPQGRRQRLMPLQQDKRSDDDNNDPMMDLERDAKDGTAISRSTHFSTQSHDAAPDELRLTDTVIYQLLLDYSKYCNTPEATTLPLEEKISNFSSTQIPKYMPFTILNHSVAKQIMERNHDLLQNTLQFTSIPIILVSDDTTEDTWIGIHSHSLEDNKMPFHKSIPQNQAQIRLEWEIHQDRTT